MRVSELESITLSREHLDMSVSDEQLRLARRVAAEIVTTLNTKYAAYFEILDAELKRRENRQQLVRDTLQKTDVTRLRARRRKRRRSHPE